MNGEIDLELYTVSIIRLNTALEKLENNKLPDEIKEMFKESCEGLHELYRDIIDDLNQEGIQPDEYYMFFENGKQIFPQYIEILKSIKEAELENILNSLINVFENLNKISEAFPTRIG